MDREQAVRHLRKRLIVLLTGLAVSYAISFGLAIFLIIDADLIASESGRLIIIGLALLGVILAFFHVRAQFRRYDYLVRMAEGSEDE